MSFETEIPDFEKYVKQPQWTTEQLLGSLVSQVEEMLVELKRINTPTQERVSSVEVKFSSPTKDHPEPRPQPVVKAYVGSVPPVEEAVMAYAATILLLERAQINGWEHTLEFLQAERAERAAA